jgi:hypothetical protein
VVTPASVKAWPSPSPPRHPHPATAPRGLSVAATAPLKLGLDQFFNEAPHPGADADFDRIELIHKKLAACASCRIQCLRLRWIALEGLSLGTAIPPLLS